MSTCVKNLDLEAWRRDVSEDQRDRMKRWSICLVQNYAEEVVIGDQRILIERQMHFVVAHLRLIVPNRTNAYRFLRANVSTGGLEPLTITADHPPLFLEDCEVMCADIQVRHLQKLRSWMPWIVRFTRRWKAFYPLYLSLYFAEMARAEDDPRVRHVLRVMALEALLSTDKTYGYKALGSRVRQLLEPQTDLYAQYRNFGQATFPPLILEDVLRDICVFRNKIAHGDAIPDQWLVPDRRPSPALGRQLNHSEELLEACTGMLSLVWQTIIDKGLQTTFATKNRMESFFKSKKGRVP